MSAQLIAALLGIAIGATTGVAQSTGSINGTVTDSASGAPVVGARVAVMCPNCYGRYPTDSAGRYSRKKLPVGTFKMEFHCPSHTSLGPEILNRMVTVSADVETVIDVRVPPGHCDEPAYSERAGVFRGYWTPGFESSAFVPCEDRTLSVAVPLLPGKRVTSPKAWADLLPSVNLQKIVWPENVPTDSWGNRTYFVVWHGVLKGPGTYGHMGVSDYYLIVDSMIAVRPRAPADCRTR